MKTKAMERERESYYDSIKNVIFFLKERINEN